MFLILHVIPICTPPSIDHNSAMGCKKLMNDFLREIICVLGFDHYFSSKFFLTRCTIHGWEANGIIIISCLEHSIITIFHKILITWDYWNRYTWTLVVIIWVMKVVLLFVIVCIKQFSSKRLLSLYWKPGYYLNHRTFSRLQKKGYTLVYQEEQKEKKELKVGLKIRLTKLFSSIPNISWFIVQQVFSFIQLLLDYWKK